MKPIYLLPLLGFLMLVPRFSQAQFYKRAFGKLTETTTTLPTYTQGADAVYLFNNGAINIEYYHSEEQFYLLTERHFSIKILNKSGFEYADIAIPFYDSGSDREKVIGLKAITYNTVNGKIEKTKASTKKVYEEEVNRNWRMLKFAMPNVKEGSVIEVCYTKKSPFLFNMDTWAFQKDIPVLTSNLSVTIPEYFNYKITEKGYIAPQERKRSTSRTSISVPENTEVIKAGVQTNPPLFPGNYTCIQQDLDWTFENIPGFEPEGYTTASSNFKSQVDFELTSIKLPSYSKVNYSKNWKAFDAEMVERSDFSQSLARVKFLSDPISGLKAKHPQLIPENVITFIQQRLSWNGKRSLFTNQSLKNCYQNKEGNSAELNFVLIGALREAGFKAWPTILSTRQHGNVSRQIPKRKDFNYVITGFVYQGDTHLVDACQPRIPEGYLPWKCLNKDFRIISVTNGSWYDFTPQSSDLTQTVEASINSDGLISGKVSATYKGYYAFNLLKESSTADDLPGLAKTIGTTNSIKVSELNIDKVESSRSKTQLDYAFAGLAKAETAEGLMFFSPILLDPTTSNPFKSEKRFYPVDFGHPFQETQEIKLTLPEGYKVESYPEATVIKLPNNKGLYSYQVELTEDHTIQITNKLIIDASVFYHEEYAALRQMFADLIEKEGEQIVLQTK